MVLWNQRRLRPYLMQPIKVIEGNEAGVFGRSQNMLGLANVPEKPGLHLVMNRKPIKAVQQNSKHDYYIRLRRP